jgi:hypothetical protein
VSNSSQWKALDDPNIHLTAEDIRILVAGRTVDGLYRLVQHSDLTVHARMDFSHFRETGLPPCIE